MHAAIHWPDQAGLTLWPFSMDHVVCLSNWLPNENRVCCPLKSFSGVKDGDYDEIKRTHVWGYPTYILEPALQDGKKIPKGKLRSRRGQFLCFSLDHESTIGLICIMATGYVLPQFHVVYNDFFTSVPNAENRGILEDIKRTTNWQTLF